MMKILHFRFLILALVLTSCAEHTVCEPNESLLTCSDSSLTDCDGFLKDKTLIIESIEGISHGEKKTNNKT